MEEAGFRVSALEHYDAAGHFHASDWSVEAGYIRRSARFYREFRFGDRNYTSLIMDGIRPTTS